ncbi:MAG TPA: two-component regulator propeller domain-containing protein [Cyclobacteriaceae bacterium]|nr:two-component regulator propeller domain-containing protein [Cyclobacteriaceae bacterium]
MRITILAIFIGSAISLAGQVSNLKFEHIGAEAGLSHSNILAILQDSRGFMWFGTRDGLNRYDGYKFTVFRNKSDDYTTIVNDQVNDLLEDKDGNIWIATLNGLDMFDWKQEKFIHYYKLMDPIVDQGNIIHTISQDHEGNIWIGTAGSGMFMLDRETKKITSYLHNANGSNSILSNSVNDVLEDSENNLWISTVSNGISLFNRSQNSFKHFHHNPNDDKSLASDKVEVLLQDRKKRIWVGTRNGLDLFEGNGFRHFKNDPRNPNSIGGNVIQCLEEDKAGNLWIGTENGGLSILNLETQNIYNYSYDDIDRLSLNSNSIWSLYHDQQGNMWIGTFSGGINFVNHQSSKFTHYRHSSSPSSISHNNIWSIFEDSKKNLWVGTDGGGLNLFDRQHGTFKAFKSGVPNRSISGNYVLSIAEDNHGNIWMGTWGDGITVFNKEKNTYKYFQFDANNPKGISSSNIWSIYKDSKGRMWIATYSGGADLYDEKTDSFLHFRNDPQNATTLSHNTVNVFLEDKKGNIWIGTNGGLNLLNKDEKSFTRFFSNYETNSFISQRLYSLQEDQLGNIWLGTENGLKYFDTNSYRFKNYTKADGLPGNNVQGLLLDDKNNLWMSTNNGVSKFDPINKTFINFSISDGLQSIEFRKGACKSYTGQMYFGGTEGLNEFIPERITVEDFEAPILLTSLEIFNKPVPITQDKTSALSESIILSKEINLSYKDIEFTIHFASLNYTNPELKKYSFMLEGFDKNWNDLSYAHSATYTNLDPGRYTFKVRGLNSVGIQSDKTLALQINIRPPFWKTWWFKVLAFLAAASLILLVIYLRVRRMRNLNRELAEAVEKKTSEINAQNKMLNLQREELAAQNEELKQSQEEISAHRDIIAKQNQNLEAEVAKRTQELLDYNQQLEQFAFISAHNLRSPVARILGLGQLLDLTKGKKDDRDEIYPRLVQTTRELDGVVRDLNTILELKKNSEAYTVVDLQTEIEIIKENLENEISITRAEITTDFTQAPNLRAVKPYLDSILYNLITNAIKYRHPDRSPIISLKTEKLESEVCLIVSDNGLGIDMNLYQDKLFNLYSRFHFHVDGKGMGLYLVKAHLVAMGGRIEIQSDVEKGSTFRAYFRA